MFLCFHYLLVFCSCFVSFNSFVFRPLRFVFVVCVGVVVTHWIHFFNFCNAQLGGQRTSESLGIIERLSGNRRKNLANVEIYECVRLSALLYQ